MATWILTALSLTGAFLNASLTPEKVLACYLLWIVANAGWVVHFYRREEWSKCFLFASYFLITANGLKNSLIVIFG